MLCQFMTWMTNSYEYLITICPSRSTNMLMLNQTHWEYPQTWFCQIVCARTMQNWNHFTTLSFSRWIIANSWWPVLLVFPHRMDMRSSFTYFDHYCQMYWSMPSILSLSLSLSLSMHSSFCDIHTSSVFVEHDKFSQSTRFSHWPKLARNIRHVPNAVGTYRLPLLAVTSTSFQIYTYVLCTHVGMPKQHTHARAHSCVQNGLYALVLVEKCRHVRFSMPASGAKFKSEQTNCLHLHNDDGLLDVGTWQRHGQSPRHRGNARAVG